MAFRVRECSHIREREIIRWVSHFATSAFSAIDFKHVLLAAPKPIHKLVRFCIGKEGLNFDFQIL
jgi:hypothetical protein